MMQQNI